MVVINLINGINTLKLVIHTNLVEYADLIEYTD